MEFISSHLSNFNRTLWIKNVPINNLFIAFGFGYFGYRTLSLLKDLVFPIFYTIPDLKSRYGVDSWAIVTGASDGVGKEFCFQLAKHGLNIILMARNKEKLETVEAELKKAYPNSKTRIVVADFSRSAEDGFLEHIYQEVEDLDISILVNNVGAPLLGAHHEKKFDEMKNAIIVNCLPQALLTRLALNKMRIRKNRSAVISICSFAACDIRPYEGVYSATKVFNDFLSRALSFENPQIDFLSVKPGLIKTKMSGYKPIDYQTCSTEDFVNASLKYLGKQTHTLGHWKHRFVGWRYSVLPEGLRLKVLAARSRGIEESI